MTGTGIRISRACRMSTLQDGAFSIAPYGDWTYTEDASGRDGVVRCAAAPDFGCAPRLVRDGAASGPGGHGAHFRACSNSGKGILSASPSRRARNRAKPIRRFGGAFNKFELMYYWASPRDLMTRRAVMMDRELYMYPLAAQPGGGGGLSHLAAGKDGLDRRAPAFLQHADLQLHERARQGGGSCPGTRPSS
jgi:hypothetical protein